MLLAAIFGFQTSAQKTDEKAIEKVIHSFALAGDENNSKVLEEVLDPSYRIVMNQLFGSKAVTTMNRAQYLEKIESKEFGGDTRTITIHKILINGNTAIAQVTFKGLKMTFKSFIQMAKAENGSWKLVSDTPTIQ